MMEAYWNCNLYTECIELFENITNINHLLKPEIGCYVTALKACTNGTILHIGENIYNEIKDNKEIINDIGIQINLIKMYGKCGILFKCKALFDTAIGNKNVISNIGIWNAMIHAFGRNGDTMNAIQLYDKLCNEYCDIIPDIKTFMHLIGSCSHSGDVIKAKEIWNNIKDETLKYDNKVISTLIDCLARKGELKEAEQLILSNDINEITAWISLISGCNKYKDKNMADNIYNEMNSKFGSDNAKVMSPASVLMSNIYGYYNEFDKTEEIWNKRILNGWKKPEGISELYVNGKIHKFLAGVSYQINDEYNEIDNKLYELLNELKNRYGYKLDETLVTRKLKNNETNESVLLRHSEKIALSYGLLKTAK
eukprot:307522_1